MIVGGSRLPRKPWGSETPDQLGSPEAPASAPRGVHQQHLPPAVDSAGSGLASGTEVGTARGLADPPEEGPCLLVVEDDHDLAESLQELLEDQGYRVKWASQAKDALRLLAEFPAEVALVDVRLGNSSGLDAIGEFKRLRPDLQCIVMTAYASTRSAVKALQEGASDYIAKPFHLHDLLEVLERTFERSRLLRQRAEAEQALRASEERYRDLYDDNPAMFITLQPDGTIVSINRFGARQLGYEVADIVGTPLTRHYAEPAGAALAETVAACLRHPDQIRRWDVELRRADGSEVWMRMSARGMRDRDGSDRLLVVCEDITEAHELARQLSIEATHDALTGLINRREMERRLERALSTARQEGVEHALCYLDLDQFKVINDVAGHVAGDELLRQLGQLLPAEVRQRDTLARLGGDEFALLMEHCTLAQARRVANALLRRIAEYRFVWGDKTFRVGVSIGLVPIGAESESLAAVLGAADSACYAAKSAGRNRVHEYHIDDEQRLASRTERQWIARLNSAFDDGRMFLCYQRVITLRRAGTGERYELFLRMRSDDGEVVTPGAFMAAAERYSLAAEVDRWVVRRAIHWLAAHPQRLGRLDQCFINLSAGTLSDQGFIDFFCGEIDYATVPTAKICFDISESTAIANLATATGFMAALQARGCRFALDNFGSGLSSFAYLKTLPVHYLKLDGNYVKDILRDPIARSMVKAMNEIAQAMGKQTIAEFVESERILACLRSLGVDYAQGYGIERPRPLDAMED